MTYIPAEVRRRVVDRADNCCEYCRVSQEDVFFRFEADHIVSEKHGGETTSDNLCLSCPDCNPYKGSDIASADPETGKATFLFHPRRITAILSEWVQYGFGGEGTDKIRTLLPSISTACGVLEQSISCLCVGRKLLNLTNHLVNRGHLRKVQSEYSKRNPLRLLG